MKPFPTTIFAIALLGCACPLRGQTVSGTINATLINKSSISLVFDSNSSGVALSGTASSSSTLNLGAVSAYGPLAAGVTRSAVTNNSFTIGTFFNIQVLEGGLSSTTFSLTAKLAATAPAGCSYLVDGVALSTTGQTLQTSSSYDTDIQHALSLVVSTAAPGAGGPATGTPLTTTVNFTATAN